MTKINARHGQEPPNRRLARQRWLPFAAAATAATLTVAAIATAGGGSAGAATAPNAQSAGNFLDATLGSKPLDPIAKLAFARAQNPGSVTDQNPLDVTALNTITLPLTGALQLPQLLGITLGAANQVAQARSNGQSYGASGAVLDSGGVSVGGNNSAPPANATINLTASGLAGNAPLPIPGGTGSADALGGVTASIGAVSSIARTPKYGPPLAQSWPGNCSQSSPTCYDIASVDLTLASPLVGGILGTVGDTLNTVLSSLASAAGGLGLPAACSFTDGLSTISLENGAVGIDATKGSIAIHLQPLLQTLLGKNLNQLPANFDLLKFLLNYLTSPGGLAAGLTGVINGLTQPLADKFTACTTALRGSGPIGQVVGLLGTLVKDLTDGQATLEKTISGLVSGLAGAAGTSPLAPIGNLLGQLIDIGVNVQPQVSSGDFKTNLDALPKQGMTPPPVPYEHTVRAIEVSLLGGGVDLALANSAAGPSGPAPAPETSSATPVPDIAAPNTAIPTGVPAGMASHNGTPVLPITLLALAVMVAAGGAAAYKFRGRPNQHRA